MSYIDATISPDGDLVYVWERNENSELKRVDWTAEYYCFIEDPHGQSESIFPNRSALTRRNFIGKNAKWSMRDWVKDYKEMHPNSPVYESCLKGGW